MVAAQSIGVNELSRSRGAWFERHVGDPHVKRANADGYRSRAVYKLEEMDRKHGLINPGSVVLELGAAPGGWTQYVAARLLEGSRRGAEPGRIVASDLLEMDPVAGMVFVQGDFTEQDTADRILAALVQTPGQGRDRNVAQNGEESGADLVLSDMAPNLTGVAGTDQARSMALAELALDMASGVLKPGGAFVVKVFQGEGFDAFMKALRSRFGGVRVRKPEASRSRSREVYLVAVDFPGRP